jgi:inner membrane protein
MERMLAVMAENPAAAAAGLVGMTCLATWPLFRDRSAMLGIYMVNNLGFVVHYAMLGQWTAVAMNGLMCVQTVVALRLVRWPQLRCVYFALMPVLAGTSLATWQGLPSLFAAIATPLSTIGRIQNNEIVLRVLLLSSTPFWTAHDLVVGSLPELFADVLSMATGATMLLRSPAVCALLRKRDASLRPWRSNTQSIRVTNL